MNSQPQMINLYVLGFVFLLEIMGSLLHWSILKRRRQVRRGPIAYLLGDKPGSSSLMIGAMFMSALAAAATDAAYLIDPRAIWETAVTYGSAPTLAIFAMAGAISHGYLLDSGSNGAVK